MKRPFSSNASLDGINKYLAELCSGVPLSPPSWSQSLLKLPSTTHLLFYTLLYSWARLSSLNESYFFPCSYTPHNLPGPEQLQLMAVTWGQLEPIGLSPWGSLAQQVWTASQFVTGRAVFSRIIAKIKWIVSSCRRDWFFLIFFKYSKLIPSKNKRQASGQYNFSAAFHKAMTKGWQAHGQTLKWMNFPSLLL